MKDVKQITCNAVEQTLFGMKFECSQFFSCDGNCL